MTTMKKCRTKTQMEKKNLNQQRQQLQPAPIPSCHSPRSPKSTQRIRSHHQYSRQAVPPQAPDTSVSPPPLNPVTVLTSTPTTPLPLLDPNSPLTNLLKPPRTMEV